MQHAEFEQYVGPLGDPDTSARYPLDEFVSFELVEDGAVGEFRVLLVGPLRFSRLIAMKVAELRVEQAEIDEYVGRD